MNAHVSEHTSIRHPGAQAMGGAHAPSRLPERPRLATRLVRTTRGALDPFADEVVYRSGKPAANVFPGI